MIYVLIGQERYLMEEKLNKLKKEYKCNDEMMNYSLYHGDRLSMKEVYDDYCTVPFFSEFKMIVLQQPLFISTKKGVKNEEDEALLLKCIEENRDDVILVLFYEGTDLDNRKKVVKALKERTNFTQYDRLTYYKVKEFTRKELKKSNCEIDEDAIDVLMSRCSYDLLQIVNECTKLSMYRSSIRLEDVELMVSRPLEDKVFELSGALVRKDIKRLVSVYKDLMVLNQEPIALIIMIANKLRSLYQVTVLLRKGYTDKEIYTMLSLNPYHLQKLKEEVGTFELSDLVTMLQKLHELDDSIKSGKIDKYLGLELFMFRI